MDKLKYSKYEWLVLIQNVNTGKTYNVTKMTTEITLTSEWMTGNSGKCELLLVVQPQDDMEWLTKARVGMDEKHGHIVQFSVNGSGQFKGYITRVGQDATHIVKVTARDQIFYLKSVDMLYTENMTASDIFTDVCNRKAHLSHEVKTPASAVLTAYYYGIDYTMFNMIKHAIDHANVAENKQYLIRDEFGSLVFTEMQELITDVKLGDNEYAIAYQFESNIEEETYNYIKAFRPNEEIGMFDVWVAQDSDTINRWGQLNHIFEVDKDMTDAEIIALTEQKLEFFNTPLETLSIVAMGHLDIAAGNGIKLNIGKIELSGCFWITNCKHVYGNNRHTMDLELFYAP